MWQRHAHSPWTLFSSVRSLRWALNTQPREVPTYSNEVWTYTRLGHSMVIFSGPTWTNKRTMHQNVMPCSIHTPITKHVWMMILDVMVKWWMKGGWMSWLIHRQSGQSVSEEEDVSISASSSSSTDALIWCLLLCSHHLGFRIAHHWLLALSEPPSPFQQPTPPSLVFVTSLTLYCPLRSIQSCHFWALFGEEGREGTKVRFNAHLGFHNQSIITNKLSMEWWQEFCCFGLRLVSWVVCVCVYGGIFLFFLFFCK